jgi:hypothetical protein
LNEEKKTNRNKTIEKSKRGISKRNVFNNDKNISIFDDEKNFYIKQIKRNIENKIKTSNIDITFLKKENSKKNEKM